MELPIQVEPQQIADFCRRNHIVRLSYFGSVLTERFGPESDVDVLVEFDSSYVPGLFALAGMEMDLSAILGRKADLRTPRDLSRRFRDEVVRSAVTHYAA